MHFHHFVRRIPDWRAAAISGSVAAVVLAFVVLMLVWATGGNVLGPLRMVAAIAFGDALFVSSSSFDFAMTLVAAVVHLTLSVCFALMLALVVAQFKFDSSVPMASVVGAIFGLLLYVFNFYVVTRAFPWFAYARGWVTSLLNVAFGVIAAITYLRLARQHAAAAER
ncbi:sodium:proline symporter [Caballeronia choica]|jgi:hypothetical protein|uniref:Sodium:proline symporter n=1 Tax=Caballeronia choica TaxID=326476 RepID=A0A158FFY3_9BURK|nr:hypothetical protein [Caballeronia choica]SAL17940.1 sodium:proline symporter [Caballeronia choica]